MPKRTPERPNSPASLALQLELPLFHTEEPVPEKADGRRRRIQLAGHVLEYTLRRGRRRTIGFCVDDRGLTVSAPRWVGLAQIDEAILEKARWITTRLGEMGERRRAVPRVRWEHGGMLPYLGQTLTIELAGAAGRQESVRLDLERHRLCVSLPPQADSQQIRDRVQGWLQSEARRIFSERLDEFAPRLEVKYRALRLSAARTRWGSCSAEGKILLNWRLIHFPMSSIDYVVAHELAHLREMNHGPRFWETVGRVLPGFEQARAQLNDPPPELLPLL